MGFLIDGVLLLVLGLTVLRGARQTISAALFSLLAGVTAVAAAFFLSTPLAAVPAEQWIAPIVERRVANDLADMVSAPHLETGRQTVESLPMGQMVKEQSAPYRELLSHWGVTPSAVRQAYEQANSATAALAAITGGFCQATARAGTFLVSALVLFAILRLLLRRVEMNLPPPPRRYQGVKRIVPALIGVVRGVLILLALTAISEWVLPYTGDRLVGLNSGTLATAELYSVLCRFNPLLIFTKL